MPFQAFSSCFGKVLIFKKISTSDLSLPQRTFLAHSFYDDSEMYYTLGLDCWPGGGRGQRACNKKDTGHSCGSWLELSSLLG